jgi:hypothetical protein
VRGKDDQAASLTLYEPLSYVYMIRRGSSRLDCVSPVLPFFYDFRGLSLGVSWGSFGGVSLRDFCWMSCI